MSSRSMRAEQGGFLFSCRMCGNCCSGDVDINLNLYDLYKLCRFMGFRRSTRLFEKKLVRLALDRAGIPLPCLFFKVRPLKFCPFLINTMPDEASLLGVCKLHPDYKPLVCKLAPAGRIVDLEQNTIEYVITPPAEQCPGMISSAVNEIEVLAESYRVESDFEVRYFRILKKMGESGVTQQEMERFFSFTIVENFEEIIRAKEKLYLPG